MDSFSLSFLRYVFQRNPEIGRDSNEFWKQCSAISRLTYQVFNGFMNPGGKEPEIDLNDLPGGLYFAGVIFNDRKQYVQVVKN